MRPVAVTVRVKSLEMGSKSQNSEIELVVEFLSLKSYKDKAPIVPFHGITLQYN